MTSISYFEQTSRNTISINLINSLREKILFETPIEETHLSLLTKLEQIFDGSLPFKDSLSYYFKDSGSVAETVPFDIYFCIKKLFGDNKSTYDFLIKSLVNSINNKSISKKDEFVLYLENIIESLDKESKNLPKPSLNFLNTMGF